MVDLQSQPPSPRRLPKLIPLLHSLVRMLHVQKLRTVPSHLLRTTGLVHLIRLHRWTAQTGMLLGEITEATVLVGERITDGTNVLRKVPIIPIEILLTAWKMVHLLLRLSLAPPLQQVDWWISLPDLVTSSTTTITVDNTAVATATNTVTLTSTTYLEVVHSTITVATPTRTRFLSRRYWLMTGQFEILQLRQRRGHLPSRMIPESDVWW